MNLIYRQAGPGDAAALADVGGKTFVETFGHLYSPQDLAAFMRIHTEESWTTELADPDLGILLVEEEGRPVAYAKVGPRSLPYRPDGPAMELRQFYVLKPWQGAGIAPRLMDWVLDEARRRKASEIYLSVFVDNHRARRFYERYGFTFVQPYAFVVGSHADEDHILKLVLD